MGRLRSRIATIWHLTDILTLIGDSFGYCRGVAVTTGMAEHSSAGSGGTRPARRRLSVDQRREELMAAALELFSRHDADEVSIDDIAAVAGASRALVYHYFGGKQELYVAALRKAAEELEERLRPQDPGGLIEVMRGKIRRYFDFVEDHAAGYAALLRGGPTQRSGEVGETLENVRWRLLGRLMKQMGVNGSGAVLRITLRSWINMAETAALDWLEHRDIERRELERLLIDYLVGLLRVAAEHDPQIEPLLRDLTPDVVGAC